MTPEEQAEIAAEQRGMRRATAILTAFTVAGENHDEAMVFSTCADVLDEILTEGGWPSLDAGNSIKLQAAFANVVLQLAVIVDAAHEAVGYASVPEKLEAIQKIALIGEGEL